MISYIFKNKTKNILAIVITALSTIKPLFYTINALNNFMDFLYFAGQLLPHVMILIYLLTLKKLYKFKELLFPAAFAINILSAVYASSVSAVNVFGIVGGIQGTIIFLKSSIYNIIAIVAFALCLIGSLFNFKNVKFLKYGTVIMMIWPVVFLIKEFIEVGGIAYWQNIQQENLSSVIIAHIQGVLQIAMSILFAFGLFNLTLNKKGENIDISPFNVKRKPKEYENQFETDNLPEIPEGAWRCMACGKILTDDIDRCECGYKK